MTEQAAAPAEPPAPERESLGQRLSDVFHRDAPAVQAVSADVQALLRGHAAELGHAAFEILGNYPGAEPVASKVLTEALSLARLAGIVL